MLLVKARQLVADVFINKNKDTNNLIIIIFLNIDVIIFKKVG